MVVVSRFERLPVQPEYRPAMRVSTSRPLASSGICGGSCFDISLFEAAAGAESIAASSSRLPDACGVARSKNRSSSTGYVVVDPLGRRYHPDTVSDYWAAACAKAGVKRIRLHDARHTCGTLMHLEHNVPVAIISAWLGHADTAFTMRTYVHNQPEKLALAAESISSWTRRKKSAQ
jgi:hypothetical protein